MTERDYIGPDPIVWVERLWDVNKGSQFSPVQKAIIADYLHHLLLALRQNDDRTDGNSAQVGA